ncbi:MAG TPA: nitroreductase [candidate division Zixibacteria bacterium]|nr:nitroreductase [candidate division Zixibacteria bacterium]
MTNLRINIISRKRRSVRKFSDRPLDDADLSVILEAGRLAPSSTNSQPWRFVVVRDEAQIGAISGSAPAWIAFNKPWMSKAPCLIVLCAEPPLTRKLTGALLPVDLPTIDVAIAGEHIVLAAAELGLGTCWVGWFDEDKIRAILDFPRSWRVISILAVGWPDEPLEDREPKRKKLSEVAFDGSADNPWTRE